MDVLGNKCSKCGFDDPRALQIDHIFGRGTQQKKELGLNNPHKYYKYLAEMDISELKNNYQILCANCNWIKRMENSKRTPHFQSIEKPSSKEGVWHFLPTAKAGGLHANF